MNSDPWKQRLSLMRGALAPLAPFLGEWVGEGKAHGESVQSLLRVRPILEGTMIEIQEVTGDYTDLCFYRWEPESGFLVLHLMAGQGREYPVEPTGTGFVWVTGMQEPAVEWIQQGEEIRQEVLWPEAEAPEVFVQYRRKNSD